MSKFMGRDTDLTPAEAILLECEIEELAKKIQKIHASTSWQYKPEPPTLRRSLASLLYRMARWLDR